MVIDMLSVAAVTRSTEPHHTEAATLSRDMQPNSIDELCDADHSLQRRPRTFLADRTSPISHACIIENPRLSRLAAHVLHVATQMLVAR